jgi:hypothetical protein
MARKKPGNSQKQKMKFSKYLILSLAAACAVPSGLQAHISYSGRDFGALVVGNPATSILTQTVSSSFGWADATDDDWGDSHRLRAFSFSLNTSASVMITVERNAGGTGPTGTFLPAFSLFSGLAHLSSPRAHDFSALSRQWLQQQFGTSSTGLNGSGKEGSLSALGDWAIGNSVSQTVIDPSDSLRFFTYIGHAADGTSANFGLAPGILGDGHADGFVTTTMHGLTPGHYSLFVGGANYAAQTTEASPFPTYGVNVSVQAVPEPSTWALLACGGLVLGAAWRRKLRR